MFIAVATSDNAVPPGVTAVPLICIVCPLTTVVPDATDITGSVKCQALDPNRTQALPDDFL